MTFDQLGLFAAALPAIEQTQTNAVSELTNTDKIMAAGRTIAMALQNGFVKRAQINAAMTKTFGGSDASGAWDAQDANNALEVALVTTLLRRPPFIEPLSEILWLETQASGFEGQYRRSSRTERLQQFSTPMTIAYLAAVAAGITNEDLVLEPSAGTGMLAAQAKRLGGNLILNELDRDRHQLLVAIFEKAFNFDALHLSAYLTKIAPSVVLMNPPFSANASAGIFRDSTIGIRHILEAMKLLTPGGRLVSIVGEGQNPEEIEEFAPVLGLGILRANIPLVGSAYTRMGTSFGTRLLVIDKGDDLEKAPIHGGTDELTPREALALLQDIPPRIRKAAPSAPSPEPIAQTLFTETAFAKATHVALTNRLTARKHIEDGAIAVPYEVIDHERIEDDDNLFAEYRPERIRFTNAKPHNASLVQTQAMAAVLPPIPSYTPLLSPEAQDALSDAQLEIVVYAGNAHQQQIRLTVPNKDLENVATIIDVRRGFYCGDSTGVGKGRISAGILADNFAQGRTRALWVSERSTLLEDATRDWTALGGDAQDLIELRKLAADAEIGLSRGVLFSTYALLRSKAKSGRSRLDQIVEWLGDDFDGIIALDEAHNAANAITGKSGNGRPKAASLQGLAVIDIQRRLPQARVVYLSATAATAIEGLSYAERLGIWGPKPAAFSTREEFLSTISAAGTGGLEIACRDLKAMGVYMSRALSMRDVEYEILEHELTEWDRQTYDTLNRLWRHVESKLEAALTQTNIKDPITGQTLDKDAMMRINGQLQSTKLRVYAAFITTIKLPTVLDLAEKKLQAGHAIIMQIANTYEATLDRAIGNIEGDTLDDIDLSPKDMIDQFLDSCFPIVQQETYKDENNQTRSRPIIDKITGKALINPEALAIRQTLLADLANYTVPAAPLDLINDHFGVANVAEVSGRSKRVVTKLGPDGEMHRYLEKRGATSNIDETHAFQDDRKKILIFSNAGSAGRSYHADRNAKNRRKRTHFLLQAGWQATVAMQGLGRSHRTNQEVAPEYILPTTTIPGEKRLTSSIARKLENLGAMTRGERSAVSGGLFNSSDNLETIYAETALSQLIKLIASDKIETIDRRRFEAQTLLKAENSEKASRLTVTRFLNRVLACDLDLQEALIEAFSNAVDEAIAAARAKNAYDEGVQTLHALSITEIKRDVIFEDPQTKAQAMLVELECKRNRITYNLDMVADGIKRKQRILGEYWAGFFEDEEYGVHARIAITIDGVRHTRIITPFEEHITSGYYVYGLNKLEAVDGMNAWADRVAKEAEILTESRYLVIGNLLPVWTLLPNSQPKIYQVRLPNEERLLGRMIDVSELGLLRQKLGLAEDDSLTPDEAIATLQKGTMIYAGRYRVMKARVNNENRFEIHDPMLISRRAILEPLGVYFERHTYMWRAYIPTDPDRAKNTIAALSRGEAIRATI